MKAAAAAAAAKSLQLCLTLCDPIDGSPPGSPVPGILQARTLEWLAISFSSAWKWKVKGKLLSHVRLLATPWSAAYQAPPSMGFSREEYWSGVPSPSLSESRGHIKTCFIHLLHRVELSLLLSGLQNTWLQWDRFVTCYLASLSFFDICLAPFFFFSFGHYRHTEVNALLPKSLYISDD